MVGHLTQLQIVKLRHDLAVRRFRRCDTFKFEPQHNFKHEMIASSNVTVVTSHILTVSEFQVTTCITVAEFKFARLAQRVMNAALTNSQV